MPVELELEADKAARRHQARPLNPGISVEVEKVDRESYRLVAPHADTGAWRTMICDAFGTRSAAVAEVFLNQLARLCTIRWVSNEDGVGGEACPDEQELNAVLAIIASVRPKDAVTAQLAAQMVAVHLLTMKASEMALSVPNAVVSGRMDTRTAAVVGKLARTYLEQYERLERAQGRRSTRQTIKVRNEKHIHHHQHVHVGEGAEKIGAQPHAAERRVGGDQATIEHSPTAATECAALPGEGAVRRLVPLPGGKR